ncbi:hypothetical protein FA15DRAFT_671444 [Coprinopsis marcescibilis]|uniref:Uncharacterized protein n=1 Tax=Coprinopsis marcescibilis TaxID=230819 RepID=A0A5C3KPT6_COPMA|nr:hypothetical protein FA15DRAFT_671444 [Coprinopsis marcescibilis]
MHLVPRSHSRRFFSKLERCKRDMGTATDYDAGTSTTAQLSVCVLHLHPILFSFMAPYAYPGPHHRHPRAGLPRPHIPIPSAHAPGLPRKPHPRRLQAVLRVVQLLRDLYRPTCKGAVLRVGGGAACVFYSRHLDYFGTHLMGTGESLRLLIRALD